MRRLILGFVAGLAVLAGCASPAPGAPSAAAPPAEPPSATASASGAPASPATGAPGAAPSLEPVKVSLTLGSLASAPSFISRARGYWREEGIELEDIPFPGGSTAQTFPALATNQLEVATGGTASGFFNAIAQGINVRVALDLTTASVGNDANGVVVRKELLDSGRLAQPADLRGLRVAYTGKGHNTQMLAEVLLDQGGLSFLDVESLEMPYPDMNTALANNNLDAAVSIEPFVALAVSGGYGARWKSWADVLPNDQVATVIYSPGFAADRKDVARRYAKAWLRGVRDYETARTKGVGREDVIAVMLQDSALKDRALYDVMPWVAINPDGRVSVEAVARQQDWFYERGYVPRKVDLDQVIDPQFADYAVAQLGPYRP